MKYKIILFCIITALQLQSCNDGGSSNSSSEPKNVLKLASGHAGEFRIAILKLDGNLIYDYCVVDNEMWETCAFDWGVHTVRGQDHWLQGPSCDGLPKNSEYSNQKYEEKEFFYLHSCPEGLEQQLIKSIVCRCFVLDDLRKRSEMSLSPVLLENLQDIKPIVDKKFGNCLMRLVPQAITFDTLNECYFLDSSHPLLDIESMHVHGKRIKSLQGIEYFKNLKILDCHDNQLTELDLGQNTKLETLDCYDNQLTELGLGQNTELETLDCHDNQIRSLDLSALGELKKLGVSGNSLTALDLSQNSLLKCLYCQNNQLKELELQANTDLIELDCGNNQLTELDLGQKTKLEMLDCNHDQLALLDLSALGELKKLNVSGNSLTALDLSRNTCLERLFCQNNQLKELDLSANKSLTQLLAYGNEFYFTDGTKLTESQDGSSKPLVKGQKLDYFSQLKPENVYILEAPPDLK